MLNNIFFLRINGTADKGFARYFNDDHRKPNMIVKLKTINKNVYPVFFAKHNICKGSELTYSYGGKNESYWWRSRNKINLCKSTAPRDSSNCQHNVTNGPPTEDLSASYTEAKVVGEHDEDGDPDSILVLQHPEPDKSGNMYNEHDQAEIIHAPRDSSNSQHDVTDGPATEDLSASYTEAKVVGEHDEDGDPDSILVLQHPEPDKSGNMYNELDQAEIIQAPRDSSNGQHDVTDGPPTEDLSASCTEAKVVGKHDEVGDPDSILVLQHPEPDNSENMFIELDDRAKIIDGNWVPISDVDLTLVSSIENKQNLIPSTSGASNLCN